ncbi:hypothetical protein JCM19239_7838 [Vibrio variabilis]|uniref:Uncharacterized protein n=1 Tax=Vibrio variabilis TaxID=990271 RepID=A0ABQ0JMH3_9VIBR|nr:hypothetical protein JCM19239_7838 [Vibrio variabilis]
MVATSLMAAYQAIFIFINVHSLPLRALLLTFIGFMYFSLQY